MKTRLFPIRYDSFDGTHLHLGSWCDDYPFLYPEASLRKIVGEEELPGDCVGSNLDLLDIIASKLNFSYSVQMEPADYKWGFKENGTWNGMLGDLTYNNKDLVINSFLLRHDILDDFDISYQYQMESIVFLLAIPQTVPQW